MKRHELRHRAASNASRLKSWIARGHTVLSRRLGKLIRNLRTRGHGPIVILQSARPCPACWRLPALQDEIGKLESNFHGPLQCSEYRLTYCRCGDLVYLDPAPSMQDLETMYVASEQFSDATYTDPKRVELVVGYMENCLTRIQQAAARDAHAPVRVLEIGAGWAWMCRAAKKLAESSFTVAQDVSSEVSESCEWVDAYVVAQLDSRAFDDLAPFDVMSMTHVIEHLVDPRAVLARCKSLLRPKGILFVTAPHRPPGWVEGDTDIAAWKTYQYTHVPAHVQYFSEASLRRLAEAAGLKLVYWNDRHEDGQAFEAWLSHPG